MDEIQKKAFFLSRTSLSSPDFVEPSKQRIQNTLYFLIWFINNLTKNKDKGAALERENFMMCT